VSGKNSREGVILEMREIRASRDQAYDREMRAGHDLMRERRWAVAYRHYAAAHDLGHAVRSRHLAAHRAVLAAAWRAGRLHSVVAYQGVFLAVAFLTSRP